LENYDIREIVFPKVAGWAGLRGPMENEVASWGQLVPIANLPQLNYGKFNIFSVGIDLVK